MCFDITKARGYGWRADTNVFTFTFINNEIIYD